MMHPSPFSSGLEEELTGRVSDVKRLRVIIDIAEVDFSGRLSFNKQLYLSIDVLELRAGF